MIELTPAPAFAALSLPVTGAGTRIDALPPARITALAPYCGQLQALHALLGGFPEPGQVLELDGLRLVWAGRDLAFAFGEALPTGIEAHAALTDQSDGWAGLSLTGPGAEALLARRLPFDVRRMAVPGAARSLLGHMPVLVIALGRDEFELWLWRSMAACVLHHLTPV
ncbi:MAG: sarcosine oxidase subunit gamma [Rhodobacteraceae bacterium]|nr:sarcosine oxidase subunit gamma [Paracoccaceae bacterium]